MKEFNLENLKSLNSLFKLGDTVCLDYLSNSVGVIKKVIGDKYFIEINGSIFNCKKENLRLYTKEKSLNKKIDKSQFNKQYIKGLPKFLLADYKDVEIRFLPLARESTNPIWRYQQECYLNSKVYTSPYTIGEDCPIKRHSINTSLTSKKSRPIFRDIFHSIINVVNDKFNPKNNGKNFIFSYGNNLKSKIVDYCLNSNILITDPAKAITVRLEIEMVKIHTDLIIPKIKKLNFLKGKYSESINSIIPNELPNNFFHYRPLNDTELNDIDNFFKEN